MRVVIQRVLEASVSISGAVTAAIGPGLLVLLGICDEDGAEDIEWLPQWWGHVKLNDLHHNSRSICF